MPNKSQESEKKQNDIKKAEKVKTRSGNVNTFRIRQPRYFIFSG